MKTEHESSSPDNLYRACLTWDVPLMRSIGSDDAQLLLRAMRLQPLGPAEAASEKRMSPLRRSAVGLFAELSGDTEEARRHYETAARHPGLKGLLGLCLLAWMGDADQRDFDRVQRRLTSLSGRGSRDLAARVHCKLAGWSLEHGWRERAIEHYDSALRLAEGDLKRTLQGLGHRFKREQIVYFDQVRGRDTTSYRWIRAYMNDAAINAVEAHLQATIKNPWTRTWSFGGSNLVEGLDIVSAELQASWAGALWLLPGVQRTRAAMILDKSLDSDDIARAIGLWVRGSGNNIPRLIDAFEGYLTQDAVAMLVGRELHQGGSVEKPAAWIEVCQALWDQIPEDLVDAILEEYTPPSEQIDLYSEAAQELGLFAHLLCRRGEVRPYVQDFSNNQLARLTRLLPAVLVSRIDPSTAEWLLRAALGQETQQSDWGSVGWANLARLCGKLDGERRSLWADRLLSQIPTQYVPWIASEALGLVGAPTLHLALSHFKQAVQKEVDRAEQGAFSGGGQSAMTELALLLLALNERSPEANAALISAATSSATSTEQRYSALTALTWIAEAGSLGPEEASAAFDTVPVNAFMTDNPAGDQRLEDMARIALRARLASTSEVGGLLLAGGRDSDVRVREVAIGTVSWLALKSKVPTPATDAALLGAVYDPNPGVQAAAVPAVWGAHFTDDAVQIAALRRLVESWSQAHRRLRLAIAHQVSQPSSHEAIRQRIMDLALSDRSWQVRWSAAEGAVRQ